MPMDRYAPDAKVTVTPGSIVRTGWFVASPTKTGKGALYGLHALVRVRLVVTNSGRTLLHAVASPPSDPVSGALESTPASVLVSLAPESDGNEVSGAPLSCAPGPPLEDEQPALIASQDKDTHVRTRELRIAPPLSVLSTKPYPASFSMSTVRAARSPIWAAWRMRDDFA